MAHGDINPDGSIAFTANQSMGGFDLTNVGGLQAGAGADLTIKLGDAAGANKLSITDSADAEIMSLDSDGKLSLDSSGNLSIQVVSNEIVLMNDDPTGAYDFSLVIGRYTSGGAGFEYNGAMKLGLDGNANVQITGNVASDINPSGTRDLGSASQIWTEVHGKTFNIYDSTGAENAVISRDVNYLYIAGGTGALGIIMRVTTGNDWIMNSSGIQFNGHQFPDADGLRNLGKSDKYYANIYGDTIHTEGVTIYDPTKVESASITRDLNYMYINGGTGSGGIQMQNAGALILLIKSSAIWYTHQIPQTDGSIDFGSTTLYYRNIYGDDLYTEGVHIQNAAHTEQADITRDDNYLQISGGTGCAAVTIGAVSTDPRIYIYDTSIQPKRDFYPTSDNVYDAGSASRRFAEGHFVNTYFSSLYPTEIAQAAEPTLASGEMRVWRDTDDNSIWLVYNNPTAGQKKVQMT